MSYYDSTTPSPSSPSPSSTSSQPPWNPDDDLTPVELQGPDCSSCDGAATIKALVFVCRFPGCGRQFQLKGNLKRHQNIHKGDKQFVCDVCGRSFLRKADMEVHQRVHTGEKPYKCKFAGCDKRFARRSDLLSHERTHDGKKPFPCEFPGCGRRFARRFDLHKHQRVHEDQDAAHHDEDGDESGVRGVCRSRSSNACGEKKSKLQLKRRLVLSSLSRHDRDQDHSVAKQANDDDDKDGGIKQEKRRAPVQPPISPTDFADSHTGKEFHFELTCTEDHVHSTPDCFSSEEWDALLGTLGSHATLTSGATTNTNNNGNSFSYGNSNNANANASITACCPDHLQSIAEAFATAHAHTHTLQQHPPPHTHTHNHNHNHYNNNNHNHHQSYSHSHSHSPHHQNQTESHSHSHSPLRGYAMGASFTSALASSLGLPPLVGASSSSPPSSSPSADAHVSSPCPIATTAKLHDHAAHTSCGHLAIQHGDHRDFVVKNHLVCLDSVKSLTGDCGTGHGPDGVGGCAKPKPKCAPQDPHRPGCGHLPVRHRDHIDYVVEDNLFCQHAGSLVDGSDQIELLDDDFWEFYGAIGSLKTD